MDPEIEFDDGSLTIRWNVDAATAVVLTVHAGKAIVMRASLDAKLATKAVEMRVNDALASHMAHLISSAKVRAAKDDEL